MNINLIKLKSVVAELRGIRVAIERVAECMEIQLAEQGINVRPPKADTSGPEPSVSYTDEEMDYAREIIDRYRREDELKAKQDE